MLRLFARHGLAGIVRTPRAQWRGHLLRTVQKANSSVATTERIIGQARHGYKLREYQEECVQAVVESISKGKRQVGVSLATGAGKTVCFSALPQS